MFRQPELASVILSCGGNILRDAVLCHFWHCHFRCCKILEAREGTRVRGGKTEQKIASDNTYPVPCVMARFAWLVRIATNLTKMCLQLAWQTCQALETSSCHNRNTRAVLQHLVSWFRFSFHIATLPLSEQNTHIWDEFVSANQWQQTGQEKGRFSTISSIYTGYFSTGFSRADSLESPSRVELILQPSLY